MGIKMGPSFPGGGGYLTKFNTGRLRPEPQPPTLLYTILAEKVSLLYTFYWGKVPLLHTYFRTLHPISKPLAMNNITGDYRTLTEEMLSKRQVLFIQFTALLNT